MKQQAQKTPDNVWGGGQWKKIEGRFLLGAGNTATIPNSTSYWGDISSTAFPLKETAGSFFTYLQPNQVPSTSVQANLYINAATCNTGGSYIYDDQFFFCVGRKIPNVNFDNLINGRQTITGGSVCQPLSTDGGNDWYSNMPPYYCINIWERELHK